MTPATGTITPRLLSVPDAAVYIGRTAGATMRLIERRAFPAVRADRRVQVDRIDLDRWIERSKE